MQQTGIETQGALSARATGAPAKDYWSVARCRRAYDDYLTSKTSEIEEQKNARRYYHSDQWTRKQIEVFNKRRQPVVTFNRIGRKIDGVVGLIERLRQDPKAYPRTPQHEQGAELATAALRYVLDEQEWKAKSPEVARDGAIDGIGGVEIEITQGDQGDAEVSFEIVEPDSFFYDPRSYRGDFSDAMYMGVGKWVDLETAIEMFPDKEDELQNAQENATDLTSNPDRDNKWFMSSGTKRLIRLVDIWYRHKGGWCWAIFTGSAILMEGESYLKNEKNQDECKFVMFSGNVDHDGDRYGFVRNMKSAQDEYNSRRSRALFSLQSRRLIMAQGAVAEVETARREWARPDGVVVLNTTDVTTGVKADDQSFDFAGQLKLMENAISELENYGPNQALIGDLSNQSGRAIQLLQQAGMAELGPYILGYKGWKLRLYRTIWNAVRQHWQAERWIRVTDDENLMQMVQVNGVGTDPMTGMPTLINQLGALDVDIVIDEGADSVNMQADAYDTLTVMASKGANIPPAVLLELAPLQFSVKKKLLDMLNQPDPAQQQAKQIALAGEAAKVDETKSKTALNMAKAQEAVTPEQAAPQQQSYEPHPMLQDAKVAADINAQNARAEQSRAAANKANQEAALAPYKMAQEAADRQADRELRAAAPMES
jgi:hypothetical protein